MMPVRSVLVVAMLLWSCIATGATYYVAPPPAGNDSNDGSSGSPWATIQNAADTAVAGDTVIIAAGTYVGARFWRSGTSLLPITFSAQPGVIVDAPGSQNSNGDNLWIRNADYITLEGFETHSAPRAGIAVQGDPEPDEVHGIIIRNNYCHDNFFWGIFTGYAKDILIESNETSYSEDEHGIYVSNSSDNPVIRGNVSHHNSSSGIQINADPVLDGDGIISNAVIDSNIIYDNGTDGAAGINLASVIDSLIVNNLLYDNHATAIAGWDDGEGSNQFGTHHNRFYHNTILQAADGRFAISFLNGSHNNEVKNNIILHKGTRGSINVDASSETGLDSDYNVVMNVFSPDDGDTWINLSQWQARGHDANSFISTPALLFLNSAGNDYHLAVGSPAINAGTALATVVDDLEGTLRPQESLYDIGAYEASAPCDDLEDPSTSITQPTGGSVSGTVTISATASDDCSIVKIEFYADATLIGTDTSSPYSVDWNTPGVSNGSYDLTSKAFDSSGNTATSDPVTVDVNNVFLFFDDFENDSTAGWTPVKGSWSESGGYVIGTVTKKGNAFSDLFAGCSVCTFEAVIRISTRNGRAAMLGWYGSARNYVEVTLMDDRNRLLFKQFSNGSTIVKRKFAVAINPNVDYRLKVVYAPTSFDIYLDDVLLGTVATSTAPLGGVGFRVKSTTGSADTARFGEILVY